MRGIYQNFSEEQYEKNFWSHKRKLKKCWYDGTTGIEILDDAIKKADRLGYTHHIERLMILSNMMLLCEIEPKAVYDWFMEMHLDSSDWVMAPNVFGMGQFSDGGIFATKPYICGSNYYLKMSRYKKGDWCEIVDGLYWRFIDKHQYFYKKNPRMSVMVGTLDRMDPKRKKHIFKKADEFIEKVTR
jgi:deoxyribodipyrimidine photolyase-related protein